MTHLPAILLFTLTGCRVTPPGAGESGDKARPDDTGVPIEPARANTAVILVMDGVRIEESFGTGSSSATGGPTIEILPLIRAEMIPSGAICDNALAAGVTITGPGHADLLLATRTEYANYANPEGAAWYRPELPTLYEAVREATGITAEQAQLLGNTLLVEGPVWSLYPGLGETEGGTYVLVEQPDEEGKPADDDGPVMEAVQAAVEGGARLVVANLHDTDRAGHYGPPPAYGENIAYLDQWIADFWIWLQSREETANSTALIIVSDHGRHRFGTEEDWRNHGDHCAGCRQIPLLVLGPGIGVGTISSAPALLDDVGRTVAWWMGAEMPYATGRVLRELFTDVDAIEGNADEVTGSLRLAMSGGITAIEQRLSSATARSSIMVDDTTISTPGVLLAEAPSLVSVGNSIFACFRELTADPASDTWPWIGRCLYNQNDAWLDIAFPEETVSPHWAPALDVSLDGSLVMGHIDNVNGAVSEGVEESSVRVVRWNQDEGWTGTDSGIDNVVVPTDPSLSVSGNTAWIAYGNSLPGQDGRYTRHIDLVRVSWPEEGGDPIYDEALNTLNLTLDDTPIERMERPAVYLSGTTVRLGFLATISGLGTTAVQMDSVDGGQSFSSPIRMDTEGRVLSHLSPSWTPTGVLLWAELSDEGEVMFCSSVDEALTCNSTGKTAVYDYSISNEAITYTASEEPYTWIVDSLKF